MKTAKLTNVWDVVRQYVGDYPEISTDTIVDLIIHDHQAGLEALLRPLLKHQIDHVKSSKSVSMLGDVFKNTPADWSPKKSPKKTLGIEPIDTIALRKWANLNTITVDGKAVDKRTVTKEQLDTYIAGLTKQRAGLDRRIRYFQNIRDLMDKYDCATIGDLADKGIVP